MQRFPADGEAWVHALRSWVDAPPRDDASGFVIARVRAPAGRGLLGAKYEDVAVVRVLPPRDGKFKVEAEPPRGPARMVGGEELVTLVREAVASSRAARPGPLEVHLEMVR